MAVTEDDARARDAADPGHRHLFHVPPADGGRYPEAAYLVGNSLGLQPRATRAAVEAELDSWARRAVEGHFEGDRPWVPYHEALRGPAARLVGGEPRETVVMGALTVNLHLLMASFYRPRGARTLIVIEDAAFPSDSYAVRSQARWHGLDPDQTVIRTEDARKTIAEYGDRIALVLLGGVNYRTGELLDIPGITAAGQAAGAVVGWDLAHAVGNVPLRLHEWGVDFAAWCSYKYLNGGPGAVGGVFVHERHLGGDAPRLEGWWGTDPALRFRMEPVSRPPATADAWQVSGPPILSTAPIRVSLALFDEVGLPALRARSERLTGYLFELLDALPVTVVTPRDPARRGAQLSVRVPDAPRLHKALRHGHGVLTDDRPPDIIRLAPVPLYSSYHDCWRAAEAIRASL
ncbi:kynureninase [Actinomycetes bacterium KLBMP 9797]